MMIIKSVLENLEWGRNFLRNSQLRSLRNLSWLPYTAQWETVRSLKLSIVDIGFLERWIHNDPNLRGYWNWFCYPTVQNDDDYLYCYTPQLELTQHGQRMKDDAYRAQARA